MSSVSILFSALSLCFQLWQEPAPSDSPPPRTPSPYGLPSGAKLGSDETATNGTRTIEYERDDGSQVEIKIKLDGSTTETVTQPNGQKTTADYKTDFNQDGSRTETREEGAGRTRRRTVDRNGKKIRTESIDEKPKDGDSTTTIRKTKTTTYDPSTGRVIETTTTTDEEGLIPGWERAIKKHVSETETFDAKGKRTGRVRENVELVEIDDNNQAVYRGTRETETVGPDGKPTKTREVMDPRTQQWGPEKTEAPPTSPETAGPEDDTTSEGPARRAGYIALSPGIIHIALPNSVGYQWGARGGVEFPCGGPCAIAAGASFQHSVGGAHFHQLRTQVEAMPGARLVHDRLFVFGVVALGHVAQVSSFTGTGGENTRLTDHGVALGIGAGTSYAVWRELYVGGRFGADLQWFPSPTATFHGYNLALDAFIGWRFGF